MDLCFIYFLNNIYIYYTSLQDEAEAGSESEGEHTEHQPNQTITVAKRNS